MRIQQIDDNQLNTKSDYNGINMSKVEPIDEDQEQDYHDIENNASEPMHEKDECSDENGNLDDMDRDTIDNKLNLGSLNDIKTDVNDNDENVNTIKKHEHSKECIEPNETNLIDQENNIDQVDNKLGRFNDKINLLRLSIVHFPIEKKPFFL